MQRKTIIVFFCLKKNYSYNQTHTLLFQMQRDMIYSLAIVMVECSNTKWIGEVRAI